MKVLMITHHFPPISHHSEFSGYERIAVYMKNLCEITVLTWGKIEKENWEDLQIKRVWTPSTDIFLERRLMLSLVAALNAEDYDVVHSLYSVPAVFPLLKKTVVATVHILPEICPDNLWLRYKGLWQKFILKRCSGVITVSSNLLEVVKRRYSPNKAFMIPHGIDTDHFRPKRKGHDFFAHTREDYDLICLTVGVHGGDLEQTLRLARKFNTILFVLVGSEKASYLKPRNVLFLGRLSEEELLNAYNSCDIFFRPLKFATANNSLLEAMSMEKTIITDRIPGVVDYLDDDTAFLVDDKDYKSAFEKVVMNEDDRKRRASTARKKAVAKFDWSVVAERTKAVYEEVLSSR